MIWWIIWFVATLIAVVAKWYFSTTIDRLRHSLSRQQREALERKGELTDMRQVYQGILRSCRDKEAHIKRLEAHIPNLQAEVQRRQASNGESA